MKASTPLGPGPGTSSVGAADQRPEDWGAVAATYEQVLDPLTALWAEEALRLVPARPRARVLDVAAGCGNLAVLAARRGADVLAIDFAAPMLDRLRRRLSTDGAAVRLALMDGHALGLRAASVDAAYSVFGLMFFADRQAGLREIWRVLRPGGQAVVTAWTRPERMVFLPLVRRAVQAAVPGWSPPATPLAWQAFGDPGVLADETTAAGFTEVTVQPVTRAGTFPSPEWLWANIGGASPVLAALLATLTPDALAAAGRAFVGELRSRFGAGPVTLPGEALVAVARKAP